jgi:hypothetical protein
MPNTIINSFFFNLVDESMRGSANFLPQLLMIRYDLIKLPSSMFSSDELKCIIDGGQGVKPPEAEIIFLKAMVKLEVKCSK